MDQEEEDEDDDLNIEEMRAKIRRYKSKMRKKEMAEGKTPQSIYAKTQNSESSNFSEN